MIGYFYHIFATDIKPRHTNGLALNLIPSKGLLQINPDLNNQRLDPAHIIRNKDTRIIFSGYYIHSTMDIGSSEQDVNP